MAGSEPKLPARSGVLYACGLAKFASLPVPSRAADASGEVITAVPITTPIPLRFKAVCADMGLFAAISSAGELWAWSREGGCVPTTITCVARGVASCSVGASFIVYSTSSGTVYQIGKGPYGAGKPRVGSARRDAPPHSARSPRVSSPWTEKEVPVVDESVDEDHSGDRVLLPAGERGTSVAACERTFVVCCDSGAVYVCGSGVNTGLEKSSDASRGALQRIVLPAVAQVALGSLHGAAVTTDGRLFVWGDGANGCLGIGRRVACVGTPVEVPFFRENGLAITHVSCTRAQPAPKRVMRPFTSGQEGPRTHVCTADGGLWIAGTGHKGLAANHLYKTMAPKHDLLSFYRVGGPAADADAPVVPTGAVEDLVSAPDDAAIRMGLRSPGDFGKDGATHYLDNAQIVFSQPVHIHSIALAADGRLVSVQLQLLVGVLPLLES